MESKKFEMTLDLNVLNHLGIKLYSNVPAVLSETVANAWDADAEEVQIDIDSEGSSITITDDGHGMSADDINHKFLRVGYKRRGQEPITPKHKRPVMGRKGIGKLSLFSIAKTIEVHSIENGEKNGFRMSVKEIEKSIEKGTSAYYPTPIPSDEITITEGTCIKLSDIQKELTRTLSHLRRRLARRFSIIGSKHNFSVSVNNKPITVADRDYYNKLQYMWHYGEHGEACLELCKNLEENENRSKPGIKFEGWIATARGSGELKTDGDVLNKLVLMMRGKVAHENILDAFGETGYYSKFIIGEIHADFLDEDNNEDIATTSRQSIIEDDPRFVELKESIRKELKYIENQWGEFRRKDGTKEALKIEAVKEWYGGLSSDHQKNVQKIFGKINQLQLADEEKATLFQYGVLTFEHLKVKKALNSIDELTGESIIQYGKVFSQLDDIESTLYYQITSGRLGIIKQFWEKTDKNEQEKIIQKYLFDHLWLLDPSWERAAKTEYMEQTIAQEFENITAKLSEEEKRGRVDIKYRTTGAKHVIIELKRPDFTTNTDALNTQIRGYHSAIMKLLEKAGKSDEQVEIICVVGKELSDWKNPKGLRISKEQLASLNARVVFYDQLIENAYQAYREYLEKSEEVSRIASILKKIETELLK